MVDVTDKLISILKKKATVKTGKITYFGWKGAGFQCGDVSTVFPATFLSQCVGNS
jgi:hypothetical protein